MKISIQNVQKTCLENEIFESILSLDHQDILELGCGDATLTRLLATTGEGRKITAAEVDTIQHRKNLLVKDLPNVNFLFAGSEDIPASDNSIDTVFMFKSLHHVPVDAMDQALQEVARVLKPGGLAYISEPVFSGDFNEILRLFHDEEKVRHAAFGALQRVVNSQLLSLKQEFFFNTPISFENFKQFSDQVIGVSYNNYQINDELYGKIIWKFEQIISQNRGDFLTPVRVDLLQKPE